MRRLTYNCLLVFVALSFWVSCSKEEPEIEPKVDIKNQGTNYQSPEAIIAQHYSVSKFTELNNRYDNGYVFVTLKEKQIIPATASASLNDYNFDWSAVSYSLGADSQLALVSPHVIRESDSTVFSPEELSLSMKSGSKASVGVSDVDSLSLTAEYLLADSAGMILVIGLHHLAP